MGLEPVEREREERNREREQMQAIIDDLRARLDHAERRIAGLLSAPQMNCGEPEIDRDGRPVAGGRKPGNWREGPRR